MAVLGTVLSVAQTLLAALDNSSLKGIYSIWGYRSHLDDLKNTVESAKNVLVDAEAKEELTPAAQDYIQKLKDAVFDADDLFDEFLTLSEQDKQLKYSEKVRRFFSPRNPVKFALTMFADVRKIRKNLDKIADNHRKFGFLVDNKPIRKRRRETCSYVHAPDIIGREGDAKAIVEKLLDADCEILTIVGVGGIGKTTLAQLVYNDQRVINEFALKYWVCVSDQDGNEFNVKIILCKILELAIGHKIDGDATLEMVQTLFRDKFEGKKYLLVLDDLWNESRNKWTELGKFLKVGAPGSRCVVTTRSFRTAMSIGNGYTYPLEGLSDEDSWSLFKITAFDIGPEQAFPPAFVEIGKKIIEKCSRVPLAIKVVGSLLYGQEKSRWESVQQSNLGEICESGREIMSILNLSYINLESSLKSCFTYCAIFPKDQVINKYRLKLHWMALGYIVPFDEGQSIEDAAEDYFLILLRRCFFQQVEVDEDGEVVSFVMHDLMHDVAQNVAMNEVCTTNHLGDKSRHLFFAGLSCTESSFSKTKIRSCYEAIRIESSLVDTLAANWICLRALTLDLVESKYLPDSIGSLLHLRFLDLANNEELEMLPDTITKLHNLETLILDGCSKLEELPVKFSKLLKLRHLHLMNCNLSCMPPGMAKLTNLCKLTSFVVADESSSGMHRVGQWKDLIHLVNLRGSIDIQISKHPGKSLPEIDWGEGSLESCTHLKAMSISFVRRSYYSYTDREADIDEALIVNLQLHPSLRELEVCYYGGANWGNSVVNLESFLPNLVKIELISCNHLQQAPLLSKLQYLKHLKLQDLRKLVYMDYTGYSITSNDATASGSGFSSSVADLLFFPSLEYLDLSYLSLIGWWPGVELADRQPPFRRLSTLVIYDCQSLTSFPPCPSLEILDMNYVSETLKIITRGDLPCDNHPTMLLQPDAKNAHLKLEVRLHDLNTLPIGRVTTIYLSKGIRTESLSEAEEVLNTCCSTLKTLTLYNCRLSLSEGLERLTSLESLELLYCWNVNWAEDNDMPWRSLHKNLRSIKLSYVDYMGKTLPSGMQHLTSLQNLVICSLNGLEYLPEWISCLSALQSLEISHCDELQSFPDSMQNLTSLQRLDISSCDRLKSFPVSIQNLTALQTLNIVRCPSLTKTFQDPSREEWRKIQHVPHFSISDDYPERVKSIKFDPSVSSC